LTVVGLFFGGCFATVVAMASPLEDTLPLRQLWTPLADDALPSRSRIGLSYSGCFAAIDVGCSSRLIWVDAFSPQLCLLCKQPLC
jgi:hypothetical protein